ncbi:MAG: hypothetical protein U0360_10840 [Dehalococcoidia bacterium]
MWTRAASDGFDAPLASLEAYVAAVGSWPAGEVALAPGEDASMAQLMLLRAARLMRLHLVTRWRDEGRVLVWSRAS